MKTPQLHTLKLGKDFAEAKLNGNKTFEIRKNDRNFRCDDTVKYICPEDEAYDFFLRDRIYLITYITTYNQQQGFVVFADRQLFDR